jgi:hypothetical protein
MTLDAALFSPRLEFARRSLPSPADSDPSAPHNSSLCFLGALSVSALDLLPALSSLTRALLHQSEAHLLFFQSSPHSLCVYLGCHQERFLLPLVNRNSPLTSLDATLTTDLRVGFQGLYLQTLSQQKTEISRNCPPASPLDATLTETSAVTPLEATLTKMRGRGWAGRWEPDPFSTLLPLRRSTALNWSAYVH